ncbi:major facilitator superfamily domain-containing protein [Talaromyces proteolyticus]|uniref:Major facilitator superfamily domain-containing protein n=1 Tax=Talaromyces proteolyticus TaxID=1131652 RepID=A0AAD4KE13_9EURO|nr:major facilitator superfamily domain-containing protein [Talaromyces proteolyticus]KAH8690017.1 major facilitator superfamily domain-containing protein [Talaromyces proteolyticus]
MADTKAAEADVYQSSEQTAGTAAVADTLPAGWMYKRFKIGAWALPWYASPKIQLGMIAFVCFLCPGMYNALSGLGGGGRSGTDTELADKMNIALYSTFAVVGFFAGSIVNRIGIRISLAFGGIGYTLYSISLLVSVHDSVDGFNIFAGAFLGICAAILWTAQGVIMVSYPTEEQKGRYFAWFWAIFNVGACIGSLIPLGQNIHTTTDSTVNDGTYIAFIVLMFVGACLAVFLCDGQRIIRSDGTKVVMMQNPSWKSEFIGMWTTLRAEPFVILLFPMFFSSNWFYTYQQNAINAAYFNTRTRSLNGFLYWFAQIVAASIIGPLLDLKGIRRTVRARIMLVVLISLTLVIYGGGYAWQKNYTRESVGKGSGFVSWDWTHDGYAGPMFLYFFYGFYDAVWQGAVYWIMGALSNSGRRTANYVGFYKGIQSAGSAVMWSLDKDKTSFMGEFASNWGLLLGSLVVAAPVILIRIRDHIDLEDDLVDVDETAETVLRTAPPVEKS